MANSTKVYRLQEDKVIARDKQVWIGIDDHQANFHVTVLDEDAAIHQQSYPNEKKHIWGLFSRLPGCKIAATYEAGPTGYRLLRWLREAGVEAFLTPASLVPVAANRRVKTDKRDSLAIATALRGKMLKRIRDLTDEEYAQRELVRTREQIVEHRADIQRQIKSKLLYHRIEKPDDLEVKDSWSKAFVTWLLDIKTDKPPLNTSIRALTLLWKELTESLKEITKEVHKLSRIEKYAQKVKLLRSIKGIGLLTAMIILTELQDFERFGTDKVLASFLGLVPRESSSGNETRKGPITGSGNRRVRTALIEASWTVKRYEPDLKTFFNRVCGGKDNRNKKAIVAVARKLSGRIRAMMLKGEPYRYPSNLEDENQAAA